MIDTPTQHVRRQRVATIVERLWLVPVLASPEIEPSALFDGETSIGSDPTCEIYLPVSGVEPHHCTIRVDGGRAVLTAHSRMTWINDGPVRETVLKPCQRLAIGPVEFRIEHRTETQENPALRQIEVLQQIVAEEVRHTPQEEVRHTPNVVTAPTTTVALLTETTSSPSVAVPSSLSYPAAVSPIADQRAESRNLAHRRALLADLQASLYEQAADTLRALNDVTRAQSQNRDEWDRVRRELSAGDTALRANRNELTRLREELQRRSARLQEDEQSLCTRRAELQQSIEQVEQERRDQYERENLLQLRIEEINQNDAALAEQEAELCRRQQRLEEERQSVIATQSADAGLLQQRAEEWSKRQEELESSLQSLRDAVSRKDEELERLRQAHAASAGDVAEREAAVTENEQASAHRTAEIERRERALSEQLAAERARLSDESSALQQQQQSLNADRLEIRDAQNSIQQQLSGLEAIRQKLAEEQERLDRDRAQLLRDQESVAEVRSRPAAVTEQLDVPPVSQSDDAAVCSDAECSAMDNIAYVDDYEVTDGPVESVDDEFDDEIVDEGAVDECEVDECGVAETGEVGSGLRSKLAELFGMSSAELNARARHQPAQTERPAPKRQPEEMSSHRNEPCETVSEPVADSQREPDSAVPTSDTDEPPATPDDADIHDPIAAYMEKLIARSRGLQSATYVPPPPPVLQTPTKQASAPTSETAALGQASPANLNTRNAAEQVPRKRPDATLERANIDAFRDLANRSARSAVAKHHSISLRHRFIAKSIATGALFVMTLALMTAHHWTGESYVLWGFIAAAGMCVSALDLLRTIARLQSNKAQQLDPVDDPSEDPILQAVTILARIAERLSWKHRAASSDDSESTSDGDAAIL